MDEMFKDLKKQLYAIFQNNFISITMSGKMIMHVKFQKYITILTIFTRRLENVNYLNAIKLF